MSGHKSERGGEELPLGVGAASQGSVLGLVSGQHSAVDSSWRAATTSCRSRARSPSQEGRPHRYLVLLEPPGVAGPLGCLVILVPSAPVFLVLGGQESTKVQTGPAPAREGRNSFACAFWTRLQLREPPPSRGAASRPAVEPKGYQVSSGWMSAQESWPSRARCC